jgi:hypothetical protein
VAVSPAGDDFLEPDDRIAGRRILYGYHDHEDQGRPLTYPQRPHFREGFHDDHPLSPRTAKLLPVPPAEPGTGETARTTGLVRENQHGLSEPKISLLPLPVGLMLPSYLFVRRAGQLRPLQKRASITPLADDLFTPEKMPRPSIPGGGGVAVAFSQGDYLLFIRGIGDPWPWVSFGSRRRWTPAVSLRAHIGNLKYCWNLARSENT